MKRQQSGFTLVEIAIVLVIIGLLLGGVLKGQELITQAKIKNVSNDLTGITAAVYSYQDRFKSLPGDDPNGSTRWSDTDAVSATNKGNGKIDSNEQSLFWQHLRKAGFVAGEIKSGSPLNAVGGQIEPVQTALAIGGLSICTHNLPAKIAEALDVQIDDGKPNTGTVRAAVETSASVVTTAPTITGYTDDGSTLYVLCKQL
ncbi:prepilin-type N-terminal cleavage/methylation domain-containing protein [Uliginosibacterium aquaticum]|uniref:Prepilin-type N-terminal cleavage/methylation domain-containing protein n=1 Tax=Uliginosibacterium aquaticum TaxID=2731212 RepID=A0ABX2II10_9RHOO|nr:prepilin-type N-terminal cleavage/methylation domain-containing protein [Uliginosibacterium aquaticum]NSL56461.1 prepilin-type N-terminal cleavage/methylation domain-containing protein [Uliginosibacterium aquaticum]